LFTEGEVPILVHSPRITIPLGSHPQVPSSLMRTTHSYLNLPLYNKMICFADVGLSVYYILYVPLCVPSL
jgi:hypothetical protein